MSELMTLEEAIFKIPEGKLNLTKEEFIQASYFMEYDGQKCGLREGDKNSGYFFWYFKDGANFTDDEFLATWLVIIPAEPRVMKAEWYVNRFDQRKTTVSSINYSYEDMIICFNQAHQNGRLERDLEVREFIQFCIDNREYMGTRWCGATMLLDKIKPLNQ